ncbi:MAG: helix-turn-helix transcriptional regulator [Chloracidobacterium sp.]|nr:helix-turn-helix transcriptional regulator [Chloracidobacterium sp.]
MTGLQLRQYRRRNRLTQQDAARSLGVSQGYLSLLEKEHRPLSEELKKKLVASLDLPMTELPSNVSKYKVGDVSDDQLTTDLATLGYPGFSHYKPSRPKNPADVLLAGLKANKRDARLVEAFPWLVLKFPDMKWDEVTRTAKMYDLQNRLGFVVSVARGMAEKRSDKTTAAALKRREADLEHSILAHEGTLCNETMTNAERRWLVDNRTASAKHWRILASLSPELARYDV